MRAFKDDGDGEVIVVLQYPNIHCVLVHKMCRGRRQNVGKINTFSAVKPRIENSFKNVLIKSAECFSDACMLAPAQNDEAESRHNQLLLNIAAHRDLNRIVN